MNFKHAESYICQKMGKKESNLPKVMKLEGFYWRGQRFHLA
jgi:hypothetical protein